MLREVLTASCRSFRVQRFPSRSKWETSTPSWFMRLRMYSREPLFGSTPSRSSASVSVRDVLAASVRRSLVYGLTGIGPLHPSAACAALVWSNGAMVGAVTGGFVR